MIKLDSISPSRIKTFDTCKFKYWLTYHCPNIELKSNWGAVHGSLIHDILENYSNNIDLDWMARLYKGYNGTLEAEDRKKGKITMPSPLVLAKTKDFHDKYPYCDTCLYKKDDHCGISLEKLDSLTGCPKGLFNDSISMLSSVIKKYQNIWPKALKNKDGVIVGTEYPFNIMLPNTDVPIIGFMDLIIEEDPDTIHIIDYKTGSWAQGYDECRNDIQAQMYSLAARKEFIDDVHGNGHKYKNVILTFDYFTQRPITLAFSNEEDIKTENFVRNKIKEIESTDWINRIVPDNVNFNERTSNNGFKYFKCRSLCDSAVCASNWKGRFQI